MTVASSRSTTERRPRRRGLAGAWLRATAALAALTLYAACSSEPARERNVVLVSIDSLRADHLGAYGYGRATSPSIDALAREGVLFERAVSQAPWTLPAHASLLSSRYARSHRVEDSESRLAPDVPTLAAALAEAGWDTAAVVSGPYMSRGFGLDTGFRLYDDSLATTHRESHRAVTSPEIHARAVALLDRLERPFFLFLHYWDVHYDYAPPEPYDRLFDPDYGGALDARDFARNPAIHAGMDPRDLAHVVALYDGEIRWVDGHIGRLVEALRERGLLEDTLLVLTSDHGDEFFEHSQKGHSHSTYGELIRVPLIFAGPGVDAGRRVPQLVQHVDVFPTLLDALGIPARSLGLQGRSLAPLLRGERLEERPAFSETRRFRREKRPGVPFGEARSVTAQGYKLIRHGDAETPDELYDLEADPGERAPLDDPPRRARLAERLAAWEAEIAPGPRRLREGLDTDTRRQLEALGYLD